MKLTKQAIKRLNESLIDVALWNGCFNVVTAKALYSGGKSFELRVEVTHPELEWQCGMHDSVELLAWKGGRGEFLEVPDELQPLIDKMKEMGKMDDSEAKKLSCENAKSFLNLLSELGVRE